MIFRNEEDNDTALVRYVTGRLPEAERRSFDERLATDDAFRAEVDRLRAIWHGTPLREPDVEAALGRLKTQLRRPVLTEPQTTSWRSYLAVAATIAVMILGGLLWQSQRSATTQTQVAQWTDVATEALQRKSLRLSDGTEIMLAPGSRLRYSADFGKQQREVYLDGEAYFAVTHDERRPFRVHTRNGIAEDLGTAFVVTAFASQNGTRVVVREGLVALNEARLEPGDLGTVDGTGQTTVERNVNVNNYLAWMRGVLVFDGTPLRDVVATLERWYGIDVQLADESAATRRITGTFTQEQTTADVVQSVALLVDLRAEQRGGIYVIH